MPLPLGAIASVGAPLVKGMKNNWKMILAAIIITALSIYIYMLNSDLDDCAESKDKLNVKLGSVTTQLTQANAAIDAQNESIRKQREDLKEAEKKASEIISKGQEEVNRLRTELDDILKKDSTINLETCEKSLNYLRESVEDLKW